MGVRSLVKCEFSEDEFQALAFAELANRFRGVAVGGPFIEDRRAERRHGVDAWIRIKQGGRLRALFLQYKVPKLVVLPSFDPTTSTIYLGRPYLRFKLHQDAEDKKAGAMDVHRQHNNLVRLRSVTGHPAYYCAPAYIDWDLLLSAFYRGAIYEGCLLGDPAKVGRVSGRETHYVTYATDLSKWAFHSEPRALGRPTSWDAALADRGPEAPGFREWTSDSLIELADALDELEEVTQEEATPAEEGSNDPEAEDSKDHDEGAEAVLRLAHSAHRVAGTAVLFVPEAQHRF